MTFQAFQSSLIHGLLLFSSSQRAILGIFNDPESVPSRRRCRVIPQLESAQSAWHHQYKASHFSPVSASANPHSAERKSPTPEERVGAYASVSRFRHDT